MNLDDLSSFSSIDKESMLSHIDGLPQQLQTAWQLGESQPLPRFSDIRQVLIAGLGGSAIGADLLAAYASPLCRIPLFVHRDYDLPAWANGPETLVITSSHSGNTEETLSSFQAALANSCQILAVTTGGKLAQFATQAGVSCWRFEHHGQPRAAVGYSFGLLLAALARLDLLPDPAGELAGAIKVMQEQQEHLSISVPVVNNPAKLLAGQLVERWVTIFGAGLLAPVARRWKGQISEVAKAWAQFEFLPEADHNTLAGVVNPEVLFANTMILFLRAPSDHTRNRLRSDLTRKVFMVEGLNADSVDAKGDTRLAHLWTCLHLGDYVAYYLAMAYGVDPTPVAAIENLKREMVAAG